VALRTEVIDLIGLDLSEEIDQGARIGKIRVMHEEADAAFMRIAVDGLQSFGVER
jgi:hypothetical protein